MIEAGDIVTFRACLAEGFDPVTGKVRFGTRNAYRGVVCPRRARVVVRDRHGRETIMEGKDVDPRDQLGHYWIRDCNGNRFLIHESEVSK